MVLHLNCIKSMRMYIFDAQHDLETAEFQRQHSLVLEHRNYRKFRLHITNYLYTIEN
eukprot:m.890724 g.890724  ORF g.890724 m.890724 type:complete len:57 (+) comp23652_c1_seq12:357-527(+)